jgi:MerR family transcriptional regulator, redox-sensitive transcriptional activator SoxR
MMIGQLEAETGVPASTIRYWERIGVLPRPLRVAGQRRYGPEAVHYLAVLRLAQACGFRLNEMRDLLHGFRSTVPAARRWQELAQKKMLELDKQMAQLKAMRRVVNRVLQCQCVELPECGRIAASVMSGDSDSSARRSCSAEGPGCGIVHSVAGVESDM